MREAGAAAPPPATEAATLEAVVKQSYTSLPERNIQTMNDYEAKQERRRQRLAERAEHKDTKARAALRRSDEIVRHIPPGQPILVGHRSEKRHRRDLAKSDRAM